MLSENPLLNELHGSDAISSLKFNGLKLPTFYEGINHNQDRVITSRGQR
jgi:hypothetical protein